MSRIEKILEAAINARKTARGQTRQAEGIPENIDGPKFQPAAVPLIDPGAVDKKIVSIREPNSLVAEQYRRLRARIKSASGDPVKSILVTSSVMGEGKTVTAVNLAVTIANEIDNTVLLVDTDLRNPMVHNYLGINPQFGLSDYLKGDVNLPDVLIKTGIGQLVVLPAGNIPENPSELLSSQKMKALASELKNRYDDRFIIYDSSPLLVTADSIPLARHMDGVLFVVKASANLQKSSGRAIALLKGCRVLGAVFNNVPEHLAEQAYPYPYGNSYGYGKKDGSGGGDRQGRQGAEK